MKGFLRRAYKLAKNILETSVEVANVKKELVFGVMDRVGSSVKGIGRGLKENPEIVFSTEVALITWYGIRLLKER